MLCRSYVAAVSTYIHKYQLCVRKSAIWEIKCELVYCFTGERKESVKAVSGTVFRISSQTHI
jgi:hypothetical protein